MPPLSTSPGAGQTDGVFVNDCFGSLTQSSGTAIVRCAPPRENARTHIAAFGYTAAATAHTVTMMPVVDTVKVTTNAAAGQAVVSMSRAPTSYDGSIWAANDYFSLMYQDGTWAAHLISSVSGLNATMTANLDKVVEAETNAYFHGAPADHTNRRFTIDASMTFAFPGGDDRFVACTGSDQNQPIIVHSDNATNAGILRFVAYIYTTV